ncbi:hypothetical protein Kisp01_48640 [Kineosporia sp. NBRC 101677]|nr:hypothetical protein Kisp01_48640 [Kineosporia sp. NBRC 101677]
MGDNGEVGEVRQAGDAGDEVAALGFRVTCGRLRSIGGGTVFGRNGCGLVANCGAVTGLGNCCGAVGCAATRCLSGELGGRRLLRRAAGGLGVGEGDLAGLALFQRHPPDGPGGGTQIARSGGAAEGAAAFGARLPRGGGAGLCVRLARAVVHREFFGALGRGSGAARAGGSGQAGRIGVAV